MPCLPLDGAHSWLMPSAKVQLGQRIALPSQKLDFETIAAAMQPRSILVQTHYNYGLSLSATCDKCFWLDNNLAPMRVAVCADDLCTLVGLPANLCV